MPFIAICGISRWSCFPSGTPRTKSACRYLIATKTNTAKTGYSQTRGPKIICVWREKAATVDWSESKALMTPMKRLRKQNGQNRHPY